MEGLSFFFLLYILLMIVLLKLMVKITFEEFICNLKYATLGNKFDLLYKNTNYLIKNNFFIDIFQGNLKTTLKNILF